MRASIVRGIFLVGSFFGLQSADATATFTNPIFKGQDPWVTLVGGTYYYSESYCGVADVCVKSSPTLTGLASAPWVGVWNHGQNTDPNGGDIWKPQIHYINGNWYIYYAADNGNNNNHHLFVLQASSSNPVGSYVEGSTGLPHGQLNERRGVWAIDPNVFTAADGNLYITFSCTNQANSNFPQNICLAAMSDALTIGGATVYISTPDRYWETRTQPVEEGPVGYTRNGNTYITFSSSASWVAADYAVGVLTNTTKTKITDPTKWSKRGPIFDSHDQAYGPGSVVFVPSVDGSEYWVLYHGIDSTTGACAVSAYNCRDIRMQQMFFNSAGYPVLGYPVDPQVALTDPAGENGAPSGQTLVAGFGNAWGDAATGAPGPGNTVGNWTWTSGNAATSSTGGAWDQLFTQRNPNPQNFEVHVDVQWQATGNSQAFPKYGVYCSYDTTNNHAEFFLDVINMVLATHAVVGGVDQGWQNSNLPAGFDKTQPHSLDCSKDGSTYTFTLDKDSSNPVNSQRTFSLTNGQAGLVVVDTMASYSNLTVEPKTYMKKRVFVDSYGVRSETGAE